jgi:hypothetical protein
LRYFAINVYPLIPQEVGGGKPERVIFEYDNSLAGTLPLKQNKESKYTIPYKLLLNTDNSYIILSPDKNHNVIEIKKNLISAIIVEQH